VTGREQPPGFVGGIGLTHLQVYEQRPAPDGVMSGCAHVHAITDEAYYVVSGTGAVELHDLEEGFRSVPLARGSYVQFPPGTLHRSVSTGGLEVLALMSNAGLAERGDARIYFGREVDEDPAEFERLVALPRGRGLEGALERRDASVRAYLRLLDLWRTDRAAYRAELARFVELHRASVVARRAEFEQIVREGPGRWLRVTFDRLDARIAGESGRAHQDEAETKLGMCGTLRQFHGLTPV
jgi:mannose-6-phosphate isomerase-like protein (cupin superfamily)